MSWSTKKKREMDEKWYRRSKASRKRYIESFAQLVGEARLDSKVSCTSNFGAARLRKYAREKKSDEK